MARFFPGILFLKPAQNNSGSKQHEAIKIIFKNYQAI